MTPKEFYKTYQADDNISPLAEQMLTLIHQTKAVHAFEFGMGTGKHLRRLREKGISTFGMDISILNVLKAQMQMDGIALSDETNLRHLVNFDCVFTVSVLDHIQEVSGIIQELKRIANKAVFLIETNDVPGPLYFPHNYHEHGFTRIGSSWTSDGPDGDGASYYLWKFTKKQ